MNKRTRQIRGYRKMFAKHYDFLNWFNIENLCNNYMEGRKMKIITDNDEYIKIVKLPNGKFVLEVGDSHDGYNIILTRQELERFAKMLLDEVKND